MNQKPRIVVVGSFITDLVFRTPRRPKLGETIIGLEFGLFTGGKGYNQAIGAARLGAEVVMVGRLGQDMFGDLFIKSLDKEGVNAVHVGRDAEAGTGVANPVIDVEAGNNSIIIVPRANMRLSPQHSDQARDVITSADILMLQLEVPLETTIYAARIAHENGVKVLLNPAPAQPLPPELFSLVDILTPNEVEASQLTGIEINTPENALQASRRLVEMGVGRVVMTLGARGAYLYGPEGGDLVSPFKVEMVDPTAAGDAFCAGFAVALARGMDPKQAVRHGNASGALAATVLGAEPSMPTLAKVTEFLDRQT